MRKFGLAFLLVLIAVVGCDKKVPPGRPLIGITSAYKEGASNNSARTEVGFTYVRAVVENGGVPFVLPTINDEEAIERYVAELDGLVLVGGLDIPPEAYGQEAHETVRELPEQRYEFERKLIRQWLSSGKPVLGVCLGMQLTNVVSGGSMIQDIPSQVGTDVVHRGEGSWHNVRIEKGSQLEEILGGRGAFVYSSHHQAVDRLGKNLKVTAHSDDGVIEALERTSGGFGLFVQWHPEAMTKDTAHRDAIYSAIVDACR